MRILIDQSMNPVINRFVGHVESLAAAHGNSYALRLKVASNPHNGDEKTKNVWLKLREHIILSDC